MNVTPFLNVWNVATTVLVSLSTMYFVCIISGSDYVDRFHPPPHYGMYFLATCMSDEF